MSQIIKKCRVVNFTQYHDRLQDDRLKKLRYDIAVILSKWMCPMTNDKNYYRLQVERSIMSANIYKLIEMKDLDIDISKWSTVLYPDSNKYQVSVNRIITPDSSTIIGYDVADISRSGTLNRTILTIDDQIYAPLTDLFTS